MKIGNKYPLGDVKADCWQVEYDSTLITAATTVTISGLTGDTAEEYILLCSFVNDYAGTTAYNLRPNNDSGSNYGIQYVRGVNAATSAGRATPTYFPLTQAIAQNELAISSLTLYAKSGHIRTLINNWVQGISGTTITGVRILGESWTNTGDEITSLVIYSDQTDGIGIGTEIILYKKVNT